MVAEEFKGQGQITRNLLPDGTHQLVIHVQSAHDCKVNIPLPVTNGIIYDSITEAQNYVQSTNPNAMIMTVGQWFLLERKTQ